MEPTHAGHMIDLLYATAMCNSKELLNCLRMHMRGATIVFRAMAPYRHLFLPHEAKKGKDFNPRMMDGWMDLGVCM